MSLEHACAALEAAKDAEAKATAARIQAERAVLDMLPAKIEGSLTEHASGWKVTATFGVNRTIDRAALESVREVIPVALFEQAVEYKPALVLAGLRYLQSNEPDTYRVLAQAITSKPAKPSVKVERVETASAA